MISPQRKTFAITPVGIAFLNKHKGPIAPKDLEQFPSYLEFKNELFNPDDKQEINPSNIDLDDLDPEEKINVGFTEIKNALIDELKNRLLQLNPTQFEELVLDLIRALGYGDKTGRIEHTGGSGDFGIDGIVHLDKLGLDKIYLQAKRYKPENKINSRQIQEFFGALKGRHATKGVFLTTSSYQESAIQYASTVSDTLVLIDGQRIAELMIESGVGVSVNETLLFQQLIGLFRVMTAIPKLLSKTRLMRGYQCLKSIYLTIHNKELEPPVTPDLQAIFDQGNAVGAEARKIYPHGVMIDNPAWDFFLER